MPRAANILPFVAILAAGAVFAGFGVGERFDLKLLDVQFRALRAWFPQPAPRDVAIVGIDEDTAKRFPEPITLWHKHLSRFLGAMVRAQPAAVGIDIVLPDRSYESVAPGLDRELMRGILEARRGFPLVLALTVDPAGKPRAVHPPFLTVAGPGATGFALFPVDRDGVVRRFDERLAEGGNPVRTFAGEIARRFGITPAAGLIDYWRGARFGYVPLHHVLEWLDAGNQSALERAFKGKPVLLGAVLPFTDRQATPVALAAWEQEAPDTPGVLLHAQALRNLLGGGFLQRVPAAAIAGLAAAAALLWFVSASTALVVVLFVALAAALFAVSTGLITQGWFAPLSAPLLTAALALGGRNAWDTASFGGYVSPPVMEEILAGRINPELGGAQKFVCVMFSDIRGYTTRSERMSPEAVIRFLNRYFEQVVALIHERGGAVVSFMGDGIMAVFGAPQPLGNPCREAFETARAILRYVGELNRQFLAEGEAPMDIGVGLHAGEAVIGHVGSSTRHDYTAIGDVTNVASRLESLTKEAGYRLVCSRAVMERLGDSGELAPLGPLAIKGHTPVEVYGYHKVSV
ncbi:MAG: adenylate/guanylate cyclase domain-containing protein [Betaproteobacteria bacterium]|nr:adenylate/guanylate cyclase domain-containing protein [Betaproteobacteria bacterium]